MPGTFNAIPKEQRSSLISNLWEEDSWEDESKFHQVPANHYFMLRQESENMRLKGRKIKPKNKKEEENG